VSGGLGNGKVSFPGDGLFDGSEEEFRRTFVAWLDCHPPPAGSRVDHDFIVAHRAWQCQAAQAGFGALHWPRQYGGSERPIGEQLVATEELALRGYDFTPLVASLYIAGPLLMAHGTPEQRARHLPLIFTGREHWCQLWSEPNAGSDLASVTTRGVLDGDNFVVSGQKVWCSYAQYGHKGLLVCRTDPESTRHRGISLLMVDLDAPGVTVRPIRQMNDRSHFNEVFLDEVVVPTSSLIGSMNDGWNVAQTVMGAARSIISVAYFGQFLARLRQSEPRQEDSWREAYFDAWSALALHRLTMMRGASGPGQSLALASLGKLLATRSRHALGRLEAADMGLVLLAHGGYSNAASTVGDLLELPGFSLAGGTTEVQKNTIAEQLLGLPR
jgi:alkylation response protein AidB-like acyl-CoA dehydrogenase